MSVFTAGGRLLPLAFLILPLAPLQAQERVGNRTLYQAGFFTQFAPTTALQLVERVPGFRLEDTDEQVRGFGQAAGNVVINGERPSTKSEQLSSVLARIPAARVARVEVGPGDGFGAEFAGKPQVLNLILNDDTGVTGTGALRLRQPQSGGLRVDGNGSAILKRGKSSFNLAFDYTNDQITNFGTDTLTSLPSGELLEQRRKFNTTNDPKGSIAAGWHHDDGPDKRINLNLSLAKQHFQLWQDNRVTPADGPGRDDELEQNYRYRQFELGGDISRPLGSGVMKLILLATRTPQYREDTQLVGVDQGVTGGYYQLQDSESAESVARLVWSRPANGGWSLELGGEAVLNRLDSAVDLYSIEAGGGRVPIELPLANATVREIRVEPFVNMGRKLGSGLRVDLGLTFERSRLTMSGDAEAERTLSYLKPKASVDWRTGKWALQGKVERTVNQLNFGDFISFAELTNDRVTGGNADLVPQTAWEFLVTAERPFLGSGVIRGELGMNFVQNVQDRIPVEDGLDAPGNLGSGTVKIARLNMDAPLNDLGITGGRLNVRFSLMDTSVVDPYTQKHRHFTNYTLWLLDVNFRQDLGKFAWGVDAYANTGSTQFWRNEEDFNYRQDPWIDVFAEFRPDKRTTLTARVVNLLDLHFYRDRTFYAPDRSSPDPVMREFRMRQEGQTVSLTLKRTFG